MGIEAVPPEAAIARAMALLADQRVCGLAWMDPTLTVTATFGPIAGFIAVGRAVSESVLPLIGLEEHILAFQRGADRRLDVPGVVIHVGDDTSARYNLALFWAPLDGNYLLLLASAQLDATLEVELLRQVRARLMAEAVTRTKSVELARANRDLEDFATIISHDLKAPVRGLRFAAADIDAAIMNGDLGKARDGLAWMQAETRRLAAMLSGLLDYSSIGRKVEAIEPVQTRAIAEAIAASVPAGSGRTVVVDGDWPVIDTLKAPLELVLRNLADNAVKHHDRPGGTVTLACQPGADALTIMVSDDGPGIAEQHRAAIFLPFRTLDQASAARTESTGLGLALVKRTVEMAGGAIELRAAGADTRGATFVVRWPRVIAT